MLFFESLRSQKVMQALTHADFLKICNGLLHSKVHFSTLNDQIFPHNAFPTH